MRRLMIMFVALAAVLAFAVPALAQDVGYPNEPPGGGGGDIPKEPPMVPPVPVPPPDVPPVPPVPPVVPPTPPPPLAETGIALTNEVALAGALLLAGGALVVFTRRRKRDELAQ